MKAFLFPLLIGTSALILAGCTHRPTLERMSQSVPSNQEATPQPAAFVPFTARFQITTNGTVRTFSNAMYLHQAEIAYLTAEDPTVIHVDQPGVTWGDFFATLPFKVTSECLTTGTGQQFCTNEQSELQFYLNKELKPEVLGQEIQADDYLEITYGPRE